MQIAIKAEARLNSSMDRIYKSTMNSIFVSIETCQGCGHLLPQKTKKCKHCGTVVASSHPKTDLPDSEREETSLMDRIKELNRVHPRNEVSDKNKGSITLAGWIFLITLTAIIIIIVFRNEIKLFGVITSTASDFGILLIFAFVAIVFPLVFFIPPIIDKKSVVATTQGVIQSSTFNIISGRDSGGHKWSKNIWNLHYTYQVFGSEFFGTKYKLREYHGWQGSISKRGQKKLEKLYQVGYRITVYYDPNKPEKAVLSRSIDFYYYVIVATAITFGLFVIVSWLLAIIREIST